MKCLELLLNISDEKPIKCPFEGCNKAYKRKSGLNLHIKSGAHLNLRNEQCNFCGQDFVSNGHVFRHVKQTHPEKYESYRLERQMQRKLKRYEQASQPL